MRCFQPRSPRRLASLVALVVTWVLLGVAGCAPLVGPSPAASPPMEAPGARVSPTPPPSPTAASTQAPPTSQPEVTPTPVSSPPRHPGATPVLLSAADLPQPPDRDLYDLVRRLVVKSSEPLPRGVNPQPLLPQAGRADTFWLLDLERQRAYQEEAELRLVSPHAYWYFQTDVDAQELEDAARVFEQEIYLPLTEALGRGWVPGVDRDQRLTLLHVPLRGAAAYYSATDQYPQIVHPYSNERAIIYVNTDVLKVGGPGYFGTLAHELQHAIHWRADPTEETWVNEGLAEVAKTLAGHPLGFVGDFLSHPQTSFVHWPTTPGDSRPNYGGASLFLAYLLAHYGGPGGARRLLEEPADGIEGINAFLRAVGQKVTFEQVLRDWAVATLLDLPSGAYSYPDLDLPHPATISFDGPGRRRFATPQFSVAYIEVGAQDGDLLLFEGDRGVPVLPQGPPGGGGCWWSNAGDAIDTTLTRAFDLGGITRATLELHLWYHTEESWDYAYVEVSTDYGETWDTLAWGRTSEANPVGNSFGPGYTGQSEGWVWDTFDLSPYAGQRILVRLEYVTDEAVNLDGLCLERVRIPELGYDYRAGQGPGEWEAQGFVRMSGPLRQGFSVQVVLLGGGGGRTRVAALPLDAQNRGQLSLGQFWEWADRAVVVVTPLTPKTRRPAGFSLELSREGEPPSG